MRTAAVFLFTVLLSTGAAAQDRGKGGPNPDPLGDRTYPQPEKPEPGARASQPVVVKSKVKRRVVRRSSGTVVTKQAAPARPKATAKTK